MSNNRLTKLGLLTAILSMLAFHSVVLAQCPSTITGAISNGVGLGMQVGSAGDVDGDGYPDYLIATRNFPGYPSEIFVMSGRTNEQLKAYRQLYDYYYRSNIAGVGDINGDGFGDILIGTVIFSGVDNAILFSLDAEVIPTSPPEVPSRRGWVLGDVDGDGINDFAITSIISDSVNVDMSEVVVYSGASGTVMQMFNGSTSGDLFGRRVANAGDVNSDGYADIMIQVFAWSSDPFTSRIYVYSGIDGAELYAFTGIPGTGNYNLAMSGVGDVNSDGFDDIAFASFGLDDNDKFIEEVQVRSGADGVELMRLSKDPADTGLAYFGAQIVGGSDIDGDGIPDIVVGAHYFGYGLEARNGAVFVYSGADGALIGSMFGEDSESFSNEFGRTVAVVGDVNADGRADILVGSSIFGQYSGEGALPNYLNSGKTYLFTCLNPCCEVAGDANSDYTMNIADVTFGISRIFNGGPAPSCLDGADSNGDGAYNIADVTYGISRIFAGGPAPVCGGSGF
jgi:FG-GAP repeat/FG-GAP-like repeat